MPELTASEARGRIIYGREGCAYDPRAVVAGSNMPPFPWLFAGSAAHPTQDALDLLAYIQSLGRPRQLAGYDSPPEPSRAPDLQEGTDPALIERGARLFRENCASCHGISGRGDGAGAARLLPRPMNLTMVEYSDGRLSRILFRRSGPAFELSWLAATAAQAPTRA